MTDVPNEPRAGIDESSDPSIWLSWLLRTIARYRGVIVLFLAAVVLVLLIAALAIVGLAPTDRSTSQRFRLNFEGASAGRYPNGQRFSSAEITGTWVVNDVFQRNQLARFTTIGKFSQALVVLDVSPQYESAAATYQARLADPRLTPIDRERISREWEASRNSLTKSDYELTFSRTERVSEVPETLVRKALLDILSTWAHVAASEHHVLEYPVSVLSPAFVSNGSGDSADPFVGALLLRSKIRHVMENVTEIEEIPGSESLRSNGQHISLQEVRIRLEEILRFRLDPLVQTIHTSGLIPNVDRARRFAESQIAYDREALQAQAASIESIREALAMYSSQTRTAQAPSPRGSATNADQNPRSQPLETVMPQVSDSFIDRFAELTRTSAGLAYRERLIDEYRRLAKSAIPAQEALNYDEQLLATLRASGRGTGAPTATIAAELNGIRSDVAGVIGEINDIFVTLSRTRTPVAELLTTTAPPTTRSVRRVSLQTLALYGVLIFLISAVLVIAAVLIRERLRLHPQAARYEVA